MADVDRTPEGDTENQTQAATEETRLLSDENSPDADPEQASSAEAPKAKLASRYGWRIFWALVTAVVTGVFVKGWIDAGADVDVSCRNNEAKSNQPFDPLMSGSLSIASLI